jgi:predicted membrane protein
MCQGYMVTKRKQNMLFANPLLEEFIFLLNKFTICSRLLKKFFIPFILVISFWKYILKKQTEEKYQL